MATLIVHQGLAPIEDSQQKLAVSNVAVQFSGLSAACTLVYVSIESQPCRITFDGSTPTTATGHLYAAGTSEAWTKKQAAAAKFIRSGGSDAVVHATEFEG
jgi:hypothetical protein